VSVVSSHVCCILLGCGEKITGYYKCFELCLFRFFEYGADPRADVMKMRGTMVVGLRPQRRTETVILPRVSSKFSMKKPGRRIVQGRSSV